MTRIPSVSRTPRALAPSAEAPTPSRPESAAPRVDQFQTVTTATPLPVTPAASGTAQVMMQHASGADAVRLDLQAVQNRMRVSVSALPDVAEGPLGKALDTSAARIRAALDEGRITVEEARQQTRNLSDMLDAFVAMERDSCTTTVTTESVEPGTRAYDVTTTAGDAIRVMVREEGSRAGQARLKLYNLRDDGRTLASAERMMIRFDLEGSERADASTDARLDVHFGLSPTPGVELLDKRIHGIMLGPDGQPLLNRGGRTIADHHFGADLPDALDDAEGFKRFTADFLETVLPRIGA